MYVVEIFLPVQRNDRSAQPQALFDQVRRTLFDRFGGLTTYSRSPADGLWKDEKGRSDNDMMIVFEVMVDTIDRDWWKQFRTTLERDFEQQTVLLRASAVEQL